jgi:hypothetical protein
MVARIRSGNPKLIDSPLLVGFTLVLGLVRRALTARL